jgi:hypothetical protein
VTQNQRKELFKITLLINKERNNIMKRVLLTVTLCLAFGVASAGERNQRGQRDKDSSDLKSLSFAEIKAACTDPDRFHNQVAPSDIEITCQDTQYKWVQTKEGSYGMDASRRVEASVVSDKYQVKPDYETVPMTSMVGSCPRFKQVAETISYTMTITCRDLTSFPGNSIEYCIGITNQARSNNPKAISTVETGEVFDLCQMAGVGNP